jgi:peptidoglycan/xylan/chitin deacetylase (PgdA/CDA1 family)
MIIKNFLFHRVNPVRDSLWDPMDVALFEKCIAFLSKNYEIIDLEKSIINNSFPSSKKKLASILFDDGYKDNIEYAVPVLKKYNCQASFYVVTDSIDNNSTTWTYSLDYLFQNTICTELDLSVFGIDSSICKKVYSSTRERIDSARTLKPYLKKLTHEKREEILNYISNSFNDVTLPKIMMNWNEIRELYNAGFNIGSHTKTHCMLGTIQDENIVSYELLYSAQKIEKETGKFPDCISYPVGSYNNATMELSKKAGYKMGLAVHQKFFDSSKDDVFAIPRTELYNESWLKTQSRMNGLLESFKKALGR